MLRAINTIFSCFAGNIVVHFFLPEMRAVYELEKLWTLGSKYDDQSKAML